ncbi:HlyD family efflux transporter periplasmic adaptor subunit [Sphingomonas sp. SM33]|uniref:HlyD family efflux transporter periplasmic adaptor subunit n=1 Tax=Sphingomonas telluris TaxID=2907998 RepID=A0ABS9VRW3_9SPHN|nr:HlyD family efflux transporter periplasmic adaptor subunit [Sphingomonas telluris]MCH8617469.1 HlyD family efflux transporter periplasmic adaptor subunit [Sphingomonas telluris]
MHQPVTVEDAAPIVDAVRKKSRNKALLGVAGAIALLGAGAWTFMDNGHVSTDNAYVGADSAQVTPLVSAAVAEVPVVNTQVVRKGQILLRLDDSDARLAVAKAEAEYFKARRQFSQTAANSGSLAAQINARDADIGQARAQLASAEANFAKARVDLQRRSELASSGAVSGEELTTARNAFSTAEANLALAKAGIAQASATKGAARESWAANEALIADSTIDTSPEVAAAKAKLDQARLDLQRTVIRAPIDGVVTNRQVQVGQRISAGSPVMTIVPIGSVYVEANFKEGQLKRVMPGQNVELISDLYGDDVVYHGTVEGFSGGTGSAFALIPAQNATGNWTKVVQRLPVRIALDPKELAKHPLRVGLSMEAEIDVSGDE